MAILTYSIVFISLIIQGFFLFSKKEVLNWQRVLFNGIGALFLLGILIYRSVTIHFIALIGTYDSLLFYAFLLLLLTLIYGVQKKVVFIPHLVFWASTVAFALLLVATSPLVSSQLKPPIPALQSSWLILHVALSFIGESFFVFSFITSIMLLRAKTIEKQKEYNRLTYVGIIIGYPIFTIGALLFGAIWAEAAWGRFWAWDPKETWALITWLIYSLYLHFRVYKKGSLRRGAWISIIGFLSTLFTFFGVNYLLKGLHSY